MVRAGTGRVMVRAGTGLSGAAEAGAAAAEAMGAASRALEGAAAAFVLLLATPAHAASLPDALGEAERRAGGAPVMGALVDGLFAGGQEIAGAPGLAALVASGLEAHGFLLSDLPRAAQARGDWLHALGRAPAEDDLLLLFFDPAAGDLRGLVAALREAVAPACVVGAGAASAADGAIRVFAHGDVSDGGLAGCWLRAAGKPRAIVTASCRPAGGPHVVTRCEGNWVLALDGRPALDVYREAVRAPLAGDLRRALDFVLAVLPAAGQGPPSPGAGLLRHLSGVSEARRAFALPEHVTRGQALAFAFRDGSSAREDLRAALRQLATEPAAFGLHLCCRERGETLFGVAGLEPAYLARELPGLPLLGLATACEIGPMGGGPALLTHAAVTVTLGGGRVPKAGPLAAAAGLV